MRSLLISNRQKRLSDSSLSNALKTRYGKPTGKLTGDRKSRSAKKTSRTRPKPSLECSEARHEQQDHEAGSLVVDRADYRRALQLGHPLLRGPSPTGTKKLKERTD